MPAVPVLKLDKNPEIERPAILKTSNPLVPGRVVDETDGVSIGASLQ